MVATEYSPKLFSMTATFIPICADLIIKPPQNLSNSPQRILVVEDEQDLRQLTAEVLIDAGHKVDVANDGEAAWTALKLTSYDLIITDQFLPKVSGIELLKKIHVARMTLPIIMATRLLPIREFALNPFLRSANILFKPYSFEKLLGMLKMVLPTTCGGRDVLPLAPLPPEPRLPKVFA
jgi:DNA-binding response OmpR family regulator